MPKLEIQNLYTEHITTEELKSKLDNMLENGDINFYAFILHNKDLTEEGKPKKEHFHLMVDYNLKTHKSSTAELTKLLKTEYSIEDARVKKITNYKAFARYLIHKDNKNKYQYNKKEIITSDLTELEEMLDNSSDKTSKSDMAIIELLELSKQNGDKLSLLADIIPTFKKYNCLTWYIQNSTKVFEFFKTLYIYIIK